MPFPDPAAARQAARIRLTDAGSFTATGPGCAFHDRCPVKIGAICEEVPPPARAAGPGHVIACHHELSVLLEEPPIAAGLRRDEPDSVTSQTRHG